MYSSEFIVYIEKDKNGKYTFILTKIYEMKMTSVNGEVKIVYFEKFKNNRSAQSRLKKIQSLSHFELDKLIKNSNPEMLNLVNCI